MGVCVCVCPECAKAYDKANVLDSQGTSSFKTGQLTSDDTQRNVLPPAPKGSPANAQITCKRDIGSLANFIAVFLLPEAGFNVATNSSRMTSQPSVKDILTKLCCELPILRSA